MKKRLNIIIIVCIIIACFLLDFFTKSIAKNTLLEFQRNEVINKFFYFTLCYNTGGAWSILNDKTIVLIMISIVALGAIIYTIIKSKSNFYKFSCSFFIGGLIGNLYDRIFYGKVTDFLDFIIFGYDFPVFNVADCFICVSAVLMLIAMIKEEKDGKAIN